MDEPVRVPRGPVGIHPVGDPVNLIMGLAGLVQEFGDLRLGVTHGHTSLSIEPLLCFPGRQSSEVGGQRRKRSGTSTAREELRMVLDFLRKGDVLMVTRIDRLARSVGDLQDMVRNTLALFREVCAYVLSGLGSSIWRRCADNQTIVATIIMLANRTAV